MLLVPGGGDISGGSGSGRSGSREALRPDQLACPWNSKQQIVGMLNGLKEDFGILDAYWLSSWNSYAIWCSMSLAFKEDIEAGIINLESVNCVEPWNGMRLPYQRGGTGHLVSRLPAFLGYSQLSMSLTLNLNLGRVTSD